MDRPSIIVDAFRWSKRYTSSHLRRPVAGSDAETCRVFGVKPRFRRWEHYDASKKAFDASRRGPGVVIVQSSNLILFLTYQGRRGSIPRDHGFVSRKVNDLSYDKKRPREGVEVRVPTVVRSWWATDE